MSKRGWPHVDDPVAVGQRLREARLAAGMSQRALSFPGCTAVYICRIEGGERVPSLQVLRELARRLGIEEDYLATGAARAAQVDPLLEAEVALQLDELELATQLYAQALEREPPAGTVRARAVGGLGEIDLRAGRFGDAVERLEEACWLLGDAIVEHPAIVGSLARAYSRRGDSGSAIGLLQHVLGDRADQLLARLEAAGGAPPQGI